MNVALFWLAIGMVLYPYVLFPLLVLLRSVLVRRPYNCADITPSVSVVIAAYNEANSIGARLDNLLSLDYPRDRLEVVVASDGSNDGTDEIVRSYAERGVRLLSLPRQGKVSALNAAAGVVSGEILIFSDANSLYAADALRVLVRPFADPEVGGVAGRQKYTDVADAGMSGDGERSYFRFDQRLKQLQSQAGSATSATGAIYAIRSSLFQPMPVGVIDDFVISTSVVAQGYRLVYEPNAVAYEAVAKTSNIEFGRKLRTLVLGLHGVWAMRQLLSPFRYGFYAVQLFSHKVLRRLVVFPLILLILVSPFVWSQGIVYQAAVLAQIVVYGLGGLGFILDRMGYGGRKIVTLPYFFCMVNFAALVAVIKLLRGYRIVRWETQRQDEDAGANLDKVSIPSRTHS